jgi:hypothetical protein
MNAGSAAALPPEAALGVARVWLQRGRQDLAIPRLRQVLEGNPVPRQAFVLLGDGLRHELRWREAEAVYLDGLARHPELPELHKGWITCLEVLEGIEAAFEHYRLRRLDRRPIENSARSVLCCSVVRNEATRLPFFLEHYRRLGVAAFFVVDNGSSDGGIELLLAQPDVHLWSSDLPFHRANFGSAWFELLLRRHGRDRWWVMADADELLMLPGSEPLPLPEVCRRLEARGRRALPALLLDMYGPGTVAMTRCAPGQDPLTVCPHFDRRAFHRCHEAAGPYRNLPMYEGGMRERVFGPEGGYLLTKVPLLRYRLDCVLSGGQHLTNLPLGCIAEARAVVLHFKYLSGFGDYVRGEVERGEHYGGAVQYHAYAQRLDQGPLQLFDPAHALTCTGPAKLLELGLLREGELAGMAGAAPAPATAPAVAPVPASGGPRPLWSVLITVHRRLEHLAEAIGSVLAQDPGPAAMEIVVVVDGVWAPEPQAALVELVQRAGQGRGRLVMLACNAGHPQVFNRALEQARGTWVHLLHDDDRVEPGFYAAMAAGIAAVPELGMAFCRHRYIDAAGQPLRRSPLERERAGLIGDWSEQIGWHCRLQPPAVVVRRGAYEAVGGYNPAAGSAFDWDLWQRLAVRFPVWFEPAVLASFREHPAAASNRLRRSGRQLDDALELLEGSGAGPEAPGFRAGRPSRLAVARGRLAAQALMLAEGFLAAGEPEAALANLRQAVRCSRSETTLQALADLISAAGEP